MGGRWFLAALGLLACQANESVFLPLPALENDELGLLVVLERGQLLAQHGPFLPGASPPSARQLLAEDSELLFLRFRIEALRAQVPELDLARLELARLEPRVSECPEVFHRDRERSIPLSRISPHVSVLDGSEFVAAEQTFDGLSLSVPIDDHVCFGGEAPSLRPFGFTLELWPEGTLVGPGGAIGLESANTRRVLDVGLAPGAPAVAVSGHLVAFVPVEGVWENRRERYWHLQDHFADPEVARYWGIRRALARSATTGADAAELILLVNHAGEKGSPSDLRSTILRLPWSAAGFGRATVLYELEPALNALGRLEDGRVFAVGDRGTAVIEGQGRGPFERLELPDLRGARLYDGVVGPSAAEPLALLQSDHALFFGDLREGGRFRVEEGPSSASGARRLTSVLHPSGRLYFSPADSAVIIARLPQGRREEVRLPVPPSLSACAPLTDACGRRLLPGSLPVLVASPRGTLVVAPGDCRAVFEYEPEKRCVRALEGLNEPPTAESNRFMYAGRATEGGAVLTGANGRVIEVVWPDE